MNTVNRFPFRVTTPILSRLKSGVIPFLLSKDESMSLGSPALLSALSIFIPGPEYDKSILAKYFSNSVPLIRCFQAVLS